MSKARRRGSARLAIGILLALVAALMPVTRVIAPSWWVFSSLSIAGLILITGIVVRRTRLPVLLAPLAELIVAALTLTGLYFSQSALLGIIPTPQTVALVPEIVGAAVREIADGVAPMPASMPMSFFVAASVAVLTIVLDHVIITTRMPLLGAVALVAVMLVPAIAVPAPMDVVAFVLLAISILFMLRTETRTRSAAATRSQSAMNAAALGIGAVAVIVAVVATPLLPAPGNAVGPVGTAGSAGINPTLRLGQDLRQPYPSEVLRVTTDAPSAPYLRAVTLSTFEGDVWEPDEGDLAPIGDPAAFGALETASDIELVGTDTRVSVQALNTPFLPVPYPATAIDGLRGDWRVLTSSRTVLGNDSSSRGQTYEVASTVPEPSLEQIREAPARGSDDDEALTAVPDDMPSIISDLALEVTAGTTNDYDRAIALQRWFRGVDFSYSLNSPVESGFDGAGTDAVAAFLEVREGYCVHFASAFAMMTRSLDMPTRLVIGYLPGVGTNETQDERMVYSVSSDRLHSWPEVYFDDIGWIAFEPTNSLGSATAFQSSIVTERDTDSAEPETPDAATPAPTSGAPERADTPDSPQAVPEAVAVAASSTTWWVLVVILAVFVLSVPALASEIRRRRLLMTAMLGNEASAWRFVQDSAIDIGIRVPASETPRAFGARLVDAGADADAVATLVRGIELASYAPTGGATVTIQRAQEIVDAAEAVRQTLLNQTSTLRKTIAIVAPRSIVIRPGSGAAG